MKSTIPIRMFLLLGLAVVSRSIAQGQTPHASTGVTTNTQGAQVTGPAYPVELLGASPPGRAVVHLGDTIKIGVYGQLGAEITTKLPNNAAAVRQSLKLYLDGVPLENLEPEILWPHGVKSAWNTNAEPSWVLLFPLWRDSQNDLNRRSWDKLLSGLHHYDVNQLQIGVGLDAAPPYLGREGELHFHVAARARVLATFGIGVALLVILMLWAITGTSMLREGGEGTAFSLGKTQMAFWGLLVALSFACVFVISGRMERIPDGVLILLGISGTTGLSSILIGDSKRAGAAPKIKELEDAKTRLLEQQKAQRRQIAADLQPLETPAEGTLTGAEKQKLETLRESQKHLDAAAKAADDALEAQKREAVPPATDGRWFRDIVSDANGMSFHRFQVVLWTLILGVVFCWAVVTTFSMPHFDPTLLLLMGISNGTYLGFKFPEKQG